MGNGRLHQVLTHYYEFENFQKIASADFTFLVLPVAVLVFLRCKPRKGRNLNILKSSRKEYDYVLHDKLTIKKFVSTKLVS